MRKTKWSEYVRSSGSPFPVEWFRTAVEEIVGPEDWQVRLVTRDDRLWLQARRRKVEVHALVLTIEPLEWGKWTPLTPPIGEHEIRKTIGEELRR